ncbi:MAG TPA: FG-GAP-like repeat-containing protein [Gemmatimonadaceae bacterium]|nr:FG-GAP-like repeat-containing protein [Gemmatimonadaceae bacterium]
MRQYRFARVCLTLAPMLILGFGEARAQILPVGSPFPSIVASVRGNGIAYDPKNKVYLTVATYGLLRGQFVSEDGALVGSTFVIQSGGSYTHFPSVAYSPDADGGAGGFLVVWHASDLAGERTSIHARMVSVKHGGPFSADNQVGADSSFYEAPVNVAYSKPAQSFMVVWGTKETANVSGVIVNNSGAAASGILPVATTGDGERWAGVACHDSKPECLVSYSGWSSNAFVRSVLLNARTGIVDAASFAQHRRTSGIWQTDTVFNSITGEYLVVWYQEPGNGLYATRVAAGSGAPTSGILTVSTRFASKDSVDLAYNPAAGTTVYVSHDLFSTSNDGAVEIDAAGNPISASSILVLPTNQGNYYPTVAANPARSEWMALTSHRFQALYGQRMTTTSVGSPAPTPTPAPTPAPTPTPAPCSYALSSGSESFGPLGGAGGFTLTTGATCAWTMGSNADWLVLGNSSITGTGTKALSYSVAPNRSKNARTGILFVGNNSLTVTQTGRTWKVTDLNGDGRNDLLWQNRSTGDLAVWHMSGINQLSGAALSPARVSDTRWKVVGTLDANQDGHVDLLWQHDDGYVSIWLMAGEVQTGAVELAASAAQDPRWRIVATGDMDRDGYEDIIWQHKDGTVAVWYMNGTQMRNGVTVTTLADADWRVVGADDFDRDGRMDLLWHHAGSGVISIWRMDDRRMLSGASVGFHVGDLDWQIEGTSDMNGDTKPDFIWRNTRTGDLAVWLMDGVLFIDPSTNGVALNPGSVSDLNWRIVGPR